MNANNNAPSNKDAVLTNIRKSDGKSQFFISSTDRFIISAHAAFEGIGIAGLISAAFWFTTAPMAPDGFKGPISTFTIAFSIIISLFLAIPIAYLAFRKLIADIDNLYMGLSSEVTDYINSHDELIYDLLKLRSLFYNDTEFKKKLLPLVEMNNNLLTHSHLSSVCHMFNQLKNTYFLIKWQSPIRLVLSSNKNTDQLNSVSLVNILNHQELSSNKSIRKAVVNFTKKNVHDEGVTFEDIIQETHQHVPNTGHLKNFVYGTASGVACTEVLLSIGWTVGSVLIGMKTIEPISNFAWISFALFSIIIGSIFGLGMGLSRHKQKNNQLIHSRLKHRNKVLNKTRDQVNNLFTEKKFIKQKVIPNMECIPKPLQNAIF